MRRVVTSEIDLEISATSDLIFQVTVAGQMLVISESLAFTQGEREYLPTEILDQSGSRLHRISAGPGPFSMRYSATLEGQAAADPTSDLDLITYLRPSRYCPADEIFPQARRQFSGLAGVEMITAVADFVATNTTYTPGLSHGTDSALTTLMSGQGVCRDYAHLVISLLRAMDIPARYVACYAPGLEPMDFHAVAEAFFEGAWYVIDATGLADRRTLVRIATGRDAADCAFLSFHGGNLELTGLRVDARLVTDTDPADPDLARLVQIG